MGRLPAGFFLSVRVLSRLFRRLFLEALLRAHHDGQLRFFGEHTELTDSGSFAQWLAPLRKDRGWSTPSARLRAQAVLEYLSATPTEWPSQPAPRRL